MPRKRKRPIATEEEVLAMFTSIMRGEIKDSVVRKSSSGDEIISVPAKVSDRSHAAELLSKRFGLFSEKNETDAFRPEIAAEIDAMTERLLAGEVDE